MTDSHGHVTGKRIILEIVREMQDGLHPLLYSRVAPGLYCVYLHPEDFTRLEGLVPRMRAEAQRALAEEMRRLNEPSRPSPLRWFTTPEEPAPPIEVPAQGFEIQIEADRDDEVARGTFVILSRLTLPALPQFEGGAATTKVFKTVVAGETRTKTEQVFKTPPSAMPAAAPLAASPSASAFAAVGPPVELLPLAHDPPIPEPAASRAAMVSSLGAPLPLSAPASVPPSGALSGPHSGPQSAVTPPVAAPYPAPAPVPTASQTPAAAPPPGTAPAPVSTSERHGRTLARIGVLDAHGPRLFVMDKPDIKIGRGGQFRLVDLQLEGSTRLSRVHARIRRDEQGRFFIKDLSEWGTTVNGVRIARGVVKEGDEIREIDVEAELPARARIGLAETLFLDFTAAEQGTAEQGLAGQATLGQATLGQPSPGQPSPGQSAPGPAHGQSAPGQSAHGQSAHERSASAADAASGTAPETQTPGAAPPSTAPPNTGAMA